MIDNAFFWTTVAGVPWFIAVGILTQLGKEKYVSKYHRRNVMLMGWATFTVTSVVLLSSCLTWAEERFGNFSLEVDRILGIIFVGVFGLSLLTLIRAASFGVHRADVKAKRDWPSRPSQDEPESDERLWTPPGENWDWVELEPNGI